MCILFLNLLKNAKKGEFKFILASNRDEFYSRPAKSAHFWDEDPSVFGGRDLTKNKEGGTWLAMSRKGKVGVLLNFTGEAPDPQKEGRGHLVAEYVKGSMTDKEYVTELSQTGDKYNKFHFIAADLRGQSSSGSYWTNKSVDGVHDSLDLAEGSQGFGNSSINEPFRKVVAGKQRFDEIVSELRSTRRKDDLIKELLELLKWEMRHYPDDVIEKLNKDVPEEFRQRYSAVCVRIPQVQYGTRTHTVVLVDWKNRADFVEVTMADPTNTTNPDWVKSHVSFCLDDN